MGHQCRTGYSSRRESARARRCSATPPPLVIRIKGILLSAGIMGHRMEVMCDGVMSQHRSSLSDSMNLSSDGRTHTHSKDCFRQESSGHEVQKAPLIHLVKAHHPTSIIRISENKSQGSCSKSPTIHTMSRAKARCGRGELWRGFMLRHLLRGLSGRLRAGNALNCAIITKFGVPTMP